MRRAIHCAVHAQASSIRSAAADNWHDGAVPCQLKPHVGPLTCVVRRRSQFLLLLFPSSSFLYNNRLTSLEAGIFDKNTELYNVYVDRAKKSSDVIRKEAVEGGCMR